MKLTSKAFAHNDAIPRRFTCRGENISPELTIEKIPEEARSLVLIMDDPDAPGGTFDHWVAYDIPVEMTTIAEGASPGTAGTNGFGKSGYGGPCPPSGTHRYKFRVYALGDRLGLPEGLGKSDVERVMEGHVLARAELMGLYAKS